jgi:peptidoglycan/LPS O-acetylase OafA/YrhL
MPSLLSPRPEHPRAAVAPELSVAEAASPSQDPTWRIGAIDLLRAVVCVSILTRHAGAEWLTALGPGYQLAPHLRPGVECFLLLSGFFLAHMFRPSDRNRLSVRQFLTRRALRLAAPYWVAVALFTLVTAASYLHAGRGLSWSFGLEFLGRVLFISDLIGYDRPGLCWSFYWSLISLFQFYILWTALFWLVRWGFLAAGREDFHGRTLSVMTLAAGAIVAVSAWAVVTGQVRSLPLHSGASGWMLPSTALYLATGVVVYQAARRSVGPATFVSLIGTLVSVGVLTADSRPIWAAAAGAVLFALARSGPARPVPGFGWVSAIGRRSFSIYLVHGLVLSVLEAAARQLGLPSWADRPGPAAVGLAVGLSVAAGFLFYRLVEAPLAGAARRVKYRV